MEEPKRYFHAEWGMNEGTTGDYVNWEDYEALRAERDALQAQLAAAREALTELLKEAVILSDEYLSCFNDYADDATICGWEKARWKRAATAAKNAEKVIAAIRALPLTDGQEEG